MTWLGGWQSDRSIEMMASETSSKVSCGVSQRPLDLGKAGGEERVRPGIDHMAIQGLADTANQPLNRPLEVRL